MTIESKRHLSAKHCAIRIRQTSCSTQPPIRNLKILGDKASKKKDTVIEEENNGSIGSSRSRSTKRRGCPSLTPRVSSGQGCQLNRNGTLMNKSLPVIRHEPRGYPLLVCHVSGFLCLAAAQKIIIGSGSSAARGERRRRSGILSHGRAEEHLDGRPTLQGCSRNYSGNLRVVRHRTARFEVTHPRQRTAR